MFLGGLISAVILLAACNGGGDTDQAEPPAPPTPSPTATETEGGAGQREPRLNLNSLNIALETVAEGLQSPLLVTNAGDGSGRLFVLEQIGRIRIISDGNLISEPFLDISSLVVAGGEQGLLGLAFHPDFGDNRKFYVNYTDRNGNTVVAEYTAHPSNPDRADPSSARPLLRIDQPFGNHNGGGIEFGPDGYLYIGTGDGGSGGDPLGNGQSLETLLGKLLRIDVDGGEPYAIPRDNPFAGEAGARPEIFAYGLRNPWRFSFDRGSLWIGDVGQSDLEEINRVPADRAPVNYGWNIMEGDECFAGPDCSRRGLTLPVATYSHEFGCSVTGGFVYRGREVPGLVGTYVLGDYCSGSIWGLNADGPFPQRLRELIASDRSISSFGLDESGELYATDLASGEVLRIVAR